MNIEERIGRLERSNRRLRWGMASMLAVGLAGAIVGARAADDVPEVLSTRELRITNAEGEPIARLHEFEGAGAISLREAAGFNDYLFVTHHKGAASVVVSVGDSVSRLDADKVKAGMSVAVGNKGLARMTVDGDKSDLSLLSSAGRAVQLEADPTGGGSITLRGDGDKVRWRSPK